MATKKKTASEALRELGEKPDNSRASRVSIRIPAGALKRGDGKQGPRPADNRAR